MRRLPLILALAGMMCLVWGSFAQAEDRMLVHFVVVSSSDDVTEADFKGLKELFLDQAGGYTEMPSTLGSSFAGGKVSPEEVNTTFLVAGKTNIASQIRAYMKDNKHFAEPFILVWEATQH